MVVADDDLLILPDRAALDSADADSADELVVVDRRNEQLQRTFAVALGGVNIVDNRLEKRRQVRALFIGAVGRDAAPRRAEQRRRLELLFRCVEVQQQLQYLVDDLVDACVRAVDLVDNDDDLMTQLQCLLQHEARLGHGTLRRVDQQQNAVDHLQNTLDLAGEVGVTRGINNVDLIIFRQNRDAALALKIAGVHDSVCHHLIFAVNAALL